MSLSPRVRFLGIAVAIAVFGLAIVVAAQPPFAFSQLESLFPGVLWRVETDDPVVALSFDDGPHREFTPRVLEILARRRAHATFFLIAERALAAPDLVARIRAEGHEVGNHYATRRSTLRDDDVRFLETLAFTDRLLGIGPNRPRLFRPPGGIARSSQVDLARRHGHTVVLGSAYPYDGQRPPAWYIRWLVTKNLAPGVIVILHDGVEDPSRAIEALPSILEAGATQGLRFVTVSELLGHRREIRLPGRD